MTKAIPFNVFNYSQAPINRRAVMLQSAPMPRMSRRQMGEIQTILGVMLMTWDRLARHG